MEKEQSNGTSTQKAVKKATGTTNAKPLAKETPTAKLEEKLRKAEEMAKAESERATKATKEAEMAKKALEEGKKQIPISEMVERVNNAKKILSRLDFFKDTRKSFDEFTLGKSGMKDEIHISDGTGHVFNTSNSETIAKVLEVLKIELDSKINSCEGELLAVL
jgi:ParB-like chromosome segregation protein Spo0J